VCFPPPYPPLTRTPLQLRSVGLKRLNVAGNPFEGELPSARGVGAGDLSGMSGLEVFAAMLKQNG
jgi:hypothetical protein